VALLEEMIEAAVETLSECYVELELCFLKESLEVSKVLLRGLDVLLGSACETGAEREAVTKIWFTVANRSDTFFKYVFSGAKLDSFAL
jgi:hypothetical protein